MPKVAFLKFDKVSKENVMETTKRAMRLADWENHVKGQKIFVKINGIADQMIPGVSTSPWIFEAVLQELRRKLPNAEIFVGDADLAAYKQLHRTIKLWGYDELSEKYGAKIVNLSNVPSKKVKVDGMVLKELDVPDILSEVDCIVNLPVMKTHIITDLTICLKNHWGLIPRGVRHNYHPVVDYVLADLNKFFRKTTFNVIDGTVAMEGNAPKTGIPKICNVILATSDRVAGDYVCAKYMGLDAEKIGHLKLAEKVGVGTTDKIELVGDKDKFEVNPFIKANPAGNMVYHWERRFRKIPGLRYIMFKTPIFAFPAFLAKHYTITWWYRREGIPTVKKILDSDYGRLLYIPLIKKAGIKDFGKFD